MGPGSCSRDKAQLREQITRMGGILIEVPLAMVILFRLLVPKLP